MLHKRGSASTKKTIPCFSQRRSPEILISQWSSDVGGHKSVGLLAGEGWKIGKFIGLTFASCCTPMGWEMLMVSLKDSLEEERHFERCTKLQNK